MELYEVLDKAADVITEHGLAKGIGHDPQGRYCIAGSLMIAEAGRITGKVEKLPNYSAAMVFLHTRLGCNPMGWNDNPVRTEQQVIDFLRESAIAAKELA